MSTRVWNIALAMPTRLILMVLTVMALAGPVAADMERQAIHHQRLAGLDLHWRGYRQAALPPTLLSAGQSDEIRVSSSVSPARYDQDNAQLIEVGGGSWWVVWARP